MTDLVEFQHEVTRSQSLIWMQMPPTRTPRQDLDLRIEAFGAEFDDADTLFALFDGNERFYTLRPLYGVVLFLDDILSAMAYTIRADHGPNERTEWVVELDERELKRLATVRYHIAEQARHD